MNKVPSRTDGHANRIIAIENIRNGNLLRRTTSSMLMQRRPATKIVPLEITRQTIDLSARLAFGRTRLKHGVIDADVLALRIDLGEDAIELRLRGSARLSDPLQQRRHRRTMLANRVRQRSRAPQEDSRVPCIITGRNKLLRQLGVRLLGKPLHPPHRNTLRRLNLRAQLNVTVTSLRSRRRNAKHNNLVSARRKRKTRANHLGKPRQVLHHMIGREDANDRLRVTLLQQKSRERTRRSSV